MTETKPSACMLGGAHDFLNTDKAKANIHLSARCKNCTFEYDGWVVGVTRAEPDPLEYENRFKNNLVALDEANIRIAELALQRDTAKSYVKDQEEMLAAIGNNKRGQQALELLEDFFKGMGPVYRDKWRIKVKALLKREGKT